MYEVPLHEPFVRAMSPPSVCLTTRAASSASSASSANTAVNAHESIDTTIIIAETRDNTFLNVFIVSLLLYG